MSTEADSRSLYFNQNAFTADGSLIYVAAGGIYAADISQYTLGVHSRRIMQGPAGDVIVSKTSQRVYFMRPNDTSLYYVDATTGRMGKICDLPKGVTISTLNSTETIAAGTYVENDGVEQLRAKDYTGVRSSALKASKMEDRLHARLPMAIFTLDINTGAITTVLHSTDWLSHVQFSPTDSTLLMYCHEGLWWKVDRIWTIRSDGTISWFTSD